jgi:hypothetical protein
MNNKETAPIRSSCTDKKKIHEDLEVAHFADHITALTVSFDQSAGKGNPLVLQLGRYSRLARADQIRLRPELTAAGPQQASPAARSTDRIVDGALRLR